VGGDHVDRGQDRLHTRKLRRKVCPQERDTGQWPGPATVEEERVKGLEREVRELRKANEILRLASAFFAQAELGRHFKP
jgi:transposase-like protein